MDQPLTYGLTHIALAVKDLDITLNFYQKVFSMQVMYHESDFIQLTTPGCRDILVFQKSPTVIADTGGIAHFGFRLKRADDVNEIRERIISVRGEILEEGEFVHGSLIYFLKIPMDILLKFGLKRLGNNAEAKNKPLNLYKYFVFIKEVTHIPLCCKNEE